MVGLYCLNRCFMPETFVFPIMHSSITVSRAVGGVSYFG